jgi:hypothetical protein
VIFFLPGLGDTLFVSAYINQDGALTAGVLVCRLRFCVIPLAQAGADQLQLGL